MKISEQHHSFERLQAQLSHPACSPRAKLDAIVSWMASTYALPVEIPPKPYARELIDKIQELLPFIEPIAYSPEMFRQARMVLENLSRAYPDLVGADSLQETFDSLILLEQTAYCYLGQPEGRFPTGSVIQHQLSHPGTPRQVLEHHLTVLEQNNSEEIAKYRRIADEWDKILSISSGCVRVLFLEESDCLDSRAKQKTFGLLTVLSVRIRKGKRNRKPAGVSEIGVGPDDQAGWMQETIQAAKLTAEHLPILKHAPHGIRNQPMMFEFDDDRTVRGRILCGAACCAAILLELARNSKEPESTTIDSSSIIVGNVRADGTILPLAPEDIPAVVEAVFFSPFQRLILPKANMAFTEDILSKLAKTYTVRKLDVLSILQQRDLFDYRHVIIQRRKLLHERLRQRLTRHQRAITMYSSFLMLAFIAWYVLFIADLDRNPKEVRVDANRYLVCNKNWKVLWEFPLESKSSSIGHTAAWIEDEYRVLLHRYAIVDLDNDGKNEVLFGNRVPLSGHSNNLHCLLSNGTADWATRLGGIDSFSGTGSGNDVVWINCIWAGPPNSTGEKHILVSTSSSQRKHYIYLLDSKGNIKGSRMTPGPVYSILVRTNIPSSMKDILLTGTCDWKSEAFVVETDLHGLTGRAPFVSILSDSGGAASHRKGAIILPQSTVGKCLGKDGIIFVCFTASSETGINLFVNESLWSILDTPLVRRKIVMNYQLDDELRLQTAQSSSTFDDAYDFLRKRGLIRDIERSTYIDEFVSTIRSMNSTSGVLAAIESKHINPMTAPDSDRSSRPRQHLIPGLRRSETKLPPTSYFRPR